jgi:hypothetical protein
MSTFREKIKELGKHKHTPLSVKDAEIVVFDECGQFVEKIKSDIVDDYTEYKGKKYYIFPEAENIDGETTEGYCFWL